MVMRGSPATGSIMRMSCGGRKTRPNCRIARREIGDADGAALPIGENRRHHRGIAKIFRLEIGHVVEHDIRKSLLLVAGEQTAEDRIAVEAGIAPPHQTGGGIDERGRAPVADDGKIKPVIRHDVANASLREICSSQRRTSARLVEAALDAGDVAADRNTDAIEIGQDLEHAQIRHIVADENGAAVGEARVGHQFANGSRLGEAGLLDFHHQFAGQELDRSALQRWRKSWQRPRAPRSSLSGASR